MDYRKDMERRGLTPRSIYQLIGQVRGFRVWLVSQDRDLADATGEDIQLFLDGKKIGSRTRYTWISSLHGFYSWAVKTGRLPADPTVEITRPKLRRTLPRPMTDRDLNHALLNADPMMRAWISLAAFAGLRAAEVAGLQIDDILADQGVLRVLGKGHHERMIPLHSRAFNAMKDAGLPRKGYLFTKPYGTPFSPKDVSHQASLYLASVGVDATLHQARHWFATRLYGQCHDLRIVQEALGHQSPTTTAIYTAFSKADAIAAVAALELTG